MTSEFGPPFAGEKLEVISEQLLRVGWRGPSVGTGMVPACRIGPPSRIKGKT